VQSDLDRRADRQGFAASIGVKKLRTRIGEEIRELTRIGKEVGIRLD
jgi:hypothetical protein